MDPWTEQTSRRVMTYESVTKAGNEWGENTDYVADETKPRESRES